MGRKEFNQTNKQTNKQTSKNKPITKSQIYEKFMIKYVAVKTLYSVIRYNRIFNIRHKFAENRSVSIKIPSL